MNNKDNNIEQMEKVGNIISYILEYVNKDISVKRICKLLYFIDEESVKISGAPITWLNFSAWQQGPVPSEFYFSAINILNEKPKDGDVLKDFIKVYRSEFMGTSYYNVSSLKKANVKAFTKYETKVLDKVLAKYGKWNGKKLEDETHKEGTLWYDVVSKNDLFERLKERAVSDYPIDFLNLIKNDELKKLNYDSAFYSMHFGNK
jgi:uncharacterized phage-associated protein